MTAESDVGVDSGKVKVDEKCGFDVNSVPAMVVGGDDGHHGVREENSVGNEDGEFSSDLKENGGDDLHGSEESRVEKEECGVSDQVLIDSDNVKEVEADRVEDEELAKENQVENKLKNLMKEDVGEAKIREGDDSELDRGENGFCDHVNHGESGIETVIVDEKRTGIDADVVDAVVENDCSEDVDAEESVDEMGNVVKDEVVDSAMENFMQGDVDGIASMQANKINDEMDSGVDVEAEDSRVENVCCGHDDSAKYSTQTVTVDEKETGVNAEVGHSVVPNSCKDNTDYGESMMETIEVDDMDAGVIDEVDDSSGCVYNGDSAIKAGFLDATESKGDGEAADSMMENNYPADVLGSEFSDGLVQVSDVVSANDEEPVLEDRVSSDAANETDGCTGTVQTVKPHVVEVEHNEVDIRSEGNVNSLFDDGVPRSSVADDNISSSRAETENETVVGEFQEPEDVVEVHLAETKIEEANVNEDAAQPHLNGVDSPSEMALGVGSRESQLPDDDLIQSHVGRITPEDSTSFVDGRQENSTVVIQSQCAQEPTVCVEEMVDEGGRTDTDPEVSEFQERVVENSDVAERIEDVGEASTDLANNACQMTEISFGTVRCLIPSSAWDESFVSKSEGLGNNSAASPGQEVKASDISDCSDKQACDEAVGAAGISTDVASASSLEGSNIGSQDSQFPNPENGNRPFYYVIRLPRYVDDKLRQQISLTEKDRDVKTSERDAVQAECRDKEAALKELKNNLHAARSEEKAARDLFWIKKEETDRAQAVMDRAWNAIILEDVDSKISQMQFRIGHETLPLNEEKLLIRQMKELMQKRTQLSSDRNQVQENQLALGQKEETEAQLKVLKKEMNALWQELTQAEEVSKATKKKLDDEIKSLNQLKSKKRAAEDLQQAEHINFVTLKDKWSRTNRIFHSCKDDRQVAINFAVAGDKEALERHCLSQDEKIRGLLNQDDEFRKSYIRCNTRSTVRRFGTLDARSLAPDEESLPLSMISNDRMEPSIKVDLVATTSNAVQEVAVEPAAVVDKAPHITHITVEQKDQTTTARKKGTSTPSKKELPEASKKAKLDQEEETEKQRNAEQDNAKIVQEEEDKAKKAKEEKELARKAEEDARRKEEEAVRLKEQKRLEEKAKAEEARERNRKKAEKAQAIAEFKAKKEAEEKEKRKEKRAKKKENKKAALSETISGSAENEASSQPEASQQEPSIKEVDANETSSVSGKRTKKPSHYVKQNKIRSIALPPPALRTRKRRWMKQLMWVLVIAGICLAWFIMGNSQNSLLYRILSFGSS